MTDEDETARVIKAMKAAARDWPEPEDEGPRYCPECGEPLNDDVHEGATQCEF